MPRRFVLPAAAAGLLLAQTATAQTIIPKLDQEGRKGDVARIAKEKAEAKFNAADLDKDGKLSREEVAKSFPFIAENFDKYDKDRDGSLSWDEYVGHNRWPK